MSQEPILLPLAQGQTLPESSAPLLAYAAATEAPVTLMTVVEQIQMLGSPEFSRLDLLKQAMQSQKGALDQLAQRVRQRHPKMQVQTEVSSGKPFIEIIRYADKINAGLIAIDANGHHKDAACQYGSTTRHLMRKSGVPLWIMAPSKRTAVKRVAAAVDIVTNDPESERLNAQIVRWAERIARQQDAKLQLCHAWQLEAEAYLIDWAGYSDMAIAKMAQEEERQRKERLEALLTELGLSPDKVPIVMLEGKPKTKIPIYLDQSDTDLVVMGTLCRSGIAGFIIGNTAERMIDAVHCSIVALKPDGFRSPVLAEEEDA